MRIILFFDLPSVTNSDKKIYRKFHKFLDHDGFIQMQESVYVKLALNSSVSNGTIERVRQNKPMKGIVQVLVITEKQYAQIQFISGAHKSNQIESEERLIII